MPSDATMKKSFAVMIFISVAVQSARADCYGVKPVHPGCVSGNPSYLCVCDSFQNNCTWTAACVRQNNNSGNWSGGRTGLPINTNTYVPNPSVGPAAGAMGYRIGSQSSPVSAGVDGFLRGIQQGQAAQERALEMRRKELEIQLLEQQLDESRRSKTTPQAPYKASKSRPVSNDQFRDLTNFIEGRGPTNLSSEDSGNRRTEAKEGTWLGRFIDSIFAKPLSEGQPEASSGEDRSGFFGDIWN